MVRFIISFLRQTCEAFSTIYIPIWLDLLFQLFAFSHIEHQDLHSNMVRFIINLWYGTITQQTVFTFQYGQIYYVRTASLYVNFLDIYIPIWLDLLLRGSSVKYAYCDDLHSNMVRFIILTLNLLNDGFIVFTFQYGQIYY